MSSIEHAGSSAARLRRQLYEVFNPDYSVGVACDIAGVIVGLHLGDEIAEHTDAWLAAEILRLARLARMKSEVGRRQILIGNGMLPHAVEARGLPSEADYRRAEAAEFGDQL
ncbi:hypothetical protein [Nocardia carnea]|uniref:hypothetical protein n=1 Tax=Nocardia carnea TaxID=37328 RepID=UPI0024582985|nr:hypothetical protein [Nocardia carnea]